jgi:hypothetical protein
MSDTLSTSESPLLLDPPGSAVSWPAVLAGAAVAISATLILATLASSLGLASVSPWIGGGHAISTVTAVTGVALIVIQWVASGLGGYLTGRLRTRWAGVHTHEVFFRDTAHGFLTWSTATVIVAALSVWGAAATTSGMLQAGASAASATSSPAPNFGSDAEQIFRSTTATPESLVLPRQDAVIILTRAALAGSLSPADHDYLVAAAQARAGVTPDVARERVASAIARERSDAAQVLAAADKARKAASALALFVGLSMVVGAFIASVAAALGGQQRDTHA